METKNSSIGDGAKVPHLSYVGDAEIGDGLISTAPDAEVVQAFGLAGQADVLVRAVCRDAEDLYRINKLVLACEGVERTETWLSMGELIPFRLAPVLERDLAEKGR